MTIEILSIIVAVLFIAICYLHYKVNQLEGYLSRAFNQNSLNSLVLASLTKVLQDKTVLTDEDLKKASDEIWGKRNR